MQFSALLMVRGSKRFSIQYRWHRHDKKPLLVNIDVYASNIIGIISVIPIIKGYLCVTRALYLCQYVLFL